MPPRYEQQPQRNKPHKRKTKVLRRVRIHFLLCLRFFLDFSRFLLFCVYFIIYVVFVAYVRVFDLYLRHSQLVAVCNRLTDCNNLPRIKHVCHFRVVFFALAVVGGVALNFHHLRRRAVYLRLDCFFRQFARVEQQHNEQCRDKYEDDFYEYFFQV